MFEIFYLYVCFFLNRQHFKLVLGPWQNWVEGTDIAYCTLCPSQAQLPHQQHAPPEWYICYNNELALTHCHQPKSIVSIRVYRAINSVSFDKCVHHYSIMQSSFSTLKIHCAPPTYPFLPPNSQSIKFLNAANLVIPFSL